MNILCKKPANLVNIDSLKCGEVFMTKRKSHTDEIGLYMVVDRSSGLSPQMNNKILAVNLATGQLRPFPMDFPVEPVEADVVINNN